ncbi:MAG: bifunctional pyr operon transcriptional regulator/uracil phosphoribosyltransferase PyrR [Betaproteobacteria bacterium]|nr:bifunctional pyr operon transcriptional regulator/uracil phosphoribosyltransferase PyrR [Betaproteobacteria bacterium]
MGHLSLDAQALYGQMRHDLRERLGPTSHLVGITSGGAWLAESLHADLGRSLALGVVSSSLHRDDFAQRGLADSAATKLPFAVDGANIWLIDDVLFTGRTIRAVVNELFDYGRPAAVHLAVLVDRSGRELPIQADYAAARLSLPANQSLRLTRDEDHRFVFSVEG